MEEKLKIKGIDKTKYPALYSTVEKNMVAYDIKKIRVIVLKSGMSAAAFSLFGNVLIVTKKLIKVMSDDETETIIAHEFSHIYNRDSIVRLTIMFIFMIPSLYFYTQIDTNNISFGQSIILLITFIIFLYGIKIKNWISVMQEIRCDREAILKTNKPKSMITALLKFYSEPLTSNQRPSIFGKMFESVGYLFWYFSGFAHPGLKDRIEHLKIAEKMLDIQEDKDII